MWKLSVEDVNMDDLMEKMETGAPDSSGGSDQRDGGLYCPLGGIAQGGSRQRPFASTCKGCF